MGDLYSELLVKKEQTSKDSVVHYGLIALLVLAVAAGLFIHAIFLIAAIVVGIACWYFIPRTDLEYEYLFVNGEFDIDMVIAKSKRKKVKSFEVSEADIIAPEKSHRLDYYNGSGKLKVQDFSSGNPDHKRFTVIIRDKGETVKVIIEPDEKMAQELKNSAPSKVFLD